MGHHSPPARHGSRCSHQTNLHPPKTSSLTTSLLSVADSSSFHLSFPPNRYATDIALSYESSPSLQTWTSLAAPLGTTTITSFDTEQITVSIPLPSSAAFYRVRATGTPGRWDAARHNGSNTYHRFQLVYY